MGIKVKGEGLGNIAVTKKGGFIRKFLVQFPDGSKDVLSVYSKERPPLEGEGVQEINFRPGDLVFHAG